MNEIYDVVKFNRIEKHHGFRLFIKGLFYNTAETYHNLSVKLRTIVPDICGRCCRCICINEPCFLNWCHQVVCNLCPLDVAHAIPFRRSSVWNEVARCLGYWLQEKINEYWREKSQSHNYSLGPYYRFQNTRLDQIHCT